MSLVKNKEAQHFKFGTHVQSQIGWHCFDTEHAKNDNAPLFSSKDGGAIKFMMLATKTNASNDFCYAFISNNWLTLEKHGF